MDYQGARHTRPGPGPADARQAPWAPADDPDGPGQGTATGPRPGPGTGGYRVPGSGTGTASGPQRVSGPGGGIVIRPQRESGPDGGTVSGPQPGVDRTPVRGFPPLAPGYQQAPTPPQGFGLQQAPTPRQGFGLQQAPTPPQGFGAWHTPGAPPAGGGAGAGFRAEEDDDPVPPASIAPGPGRRSARPARPSRRSSRVAWLVLTAVVIVAAGGYVGYKYLYEPRVNAPVPSSLRLPADAPGSPDFDAALGKWQHIGTRAQDPQPLTLDALFPPQFELNGSSYVRTAADVSENCTVAVFGSNLQAALQAGHCTQVLRASYISGNGTMMGTVGVANLISSSAAQKAGQTTGPQEIIAPLAAQKGPTSKLGNGTGVVQAEIKGHYLILMWAEFTSLKSPSTSAQRQQLEQFAANLVTGSANINLSTRMLTGKP